MRYINRHIDLKIPIPDNYRFNRTRTETLNVDVAIFVDILNDLIKENIPIGWTLSAEDYRDYQGEIKNE